MRGRIFSSCLVGLSAALIACGGAAEEYQYRPEIANVRIAREPAQAYQLPPEAPQGEVRVASTGLVDLRTGDGRTTRALHVRMLITNEGDDSPWWIDLGRTSLQLAGANILPMLVNTDATGAVIPIARRQRRMLDFYFPAPAYLRSNGQLPGFEVLWTVRTATRDVSQRTSFTRVQLEPVTSPDVVYAGTWAPYWWYGPWYPHGWWGPHRVIVVRHR
jgi:hypothetical protein